MFFVRMKKYLLFIIGFNFIVSCAKQEKVPLNERVEEFRVSECRRDYGLDSIGILTKKIENKNLKVSLGYVLNCSWEQAYFKNITEKNDTLIVTLDRPHSEDGQYPLTSCDCFFYFDFVVRDYDKLPKAIRVVDIFTEDKFWDETAIFKTEIEEIIIESN